MISNRMVIATLLITSMFFISPALACNYPGPSGSSISVTIYASDGTTPLPGATVSIQNGSNGETYISDCTNSNGQFQFTASPIANGLTYKVHVTYGGDQINVESSGSMLQCVQHSVDSGTFTLGQNEAKSITLVMPGVTVVHGGGETPSACPTDNPTVTPKPSNGIHAPYPPMGPGMTPGTVYGAVIINESSKAASGAYVAIVSCTDSRIVYSYTYTDNDGFFQILNVNSTSNAVYKIYAVDSCGNKAYSAPFVVGSGASVRVDMVLGDKKVCTVTPQPSATATATVLPVNDTITPTPTTADISTDHAADLSVGQDHTGILDQITGFIDSIISSIF
jgi:hypothetical protein